MARIRTIDGAYAAIKAHDPNTAMSKNALRRMVLSGEIPSVQSGNKRLINLDLLERYLAGESQE